MTVKNSTVVTVNASGQAWIYFGPCLANDVATACYSTPIAVATDGDRLNMTSSNPSHWNTLVNQTGYSATDFRQNNTNNLSGRVVSMGVRLTYVGTDLNRGGMIACYADPNHLNMNDTGITYNSGRPGYVIRPIGKGPCEVSLSAVDRDEMEYYDWLASSTEANFLAVAPFSRGSQFGGGVTAGGMPGAIYISGAAVGASFLLETICHFELLGRPVASRVTNSTPDSRGAETVLGAVQRAPSIMEMAGNITQSAAFRSGLSSVLKEMIPLAANAYRYRQTRGGSLIEL